MAGKAKVLAAADMSVDGALFIKRLMGIETLPKVLALLGNVYYRQDQEVVDDHTIPALVEAGLITPINKPPYGIVDPGLASWMRVLEQPDIEATCRAVDGERMRRAVIARRGEQHVLALRRNDSVVIQGIWSHGESLDDVVAKPLWTAMRVDEKTLAPPPAEFEPATLSLEDVKALAAGKPGEASRDLRHRYQLDLTATKILNSVSEYNGQRCEIAMAQNRGIETVETPVGIGVADTPYGRVVSAVRKQGSQTWVTFGPGTFQRFKAAVADLVQFTPGRNWFAAKPWS